MKASVMPDRDVEVGDLVLVGLAGDELLHIRMIHPQDGHVGAAAGAALGDLAEGVVVDAQEADRPGGLPGRGFDERALGAQVREGEAVAAAGLLDEGGIAQGLEDPAGFAAHIIADGQDKAGSQLPEGGAGAGEGGRIGEEALGAEKLVIFLRHGENFAPVDLPRFWQRCRRPARTSPPPIPRAAAPHRGGRSV